MTRLQLFLVHSARWMNGWMDGRLLHSKIAVNVDNDNDDDDAKGKYLQMFVNICPHKINHIFASFRLHSPHTYIEPKIPNSN